MIDALRAIPVTGPRPKPSEYPRDGCPECNGPVKAVLVTCDLDEEHERWDCQNKDCNETSIHEDDLVRVNGPEEYPVEEMLDVAAELKAGRVMPSLVPWVKARVRV